MFSYCVVCASGIRYTSYHRIIVYYSVRLLNVYYFRIASSGTSISRVFQSTDTAVVVSPRPSEHNNIIYVHTADTADTAHARSLRAHYSACGYGRGGGGGDDDDDHDDHCCYDRRRDDDRRTVDDTATPAGPSRPAIVLSLGTPVRRTSKQHSR